MERNPRAEVVAFCDLRRDEEIDCVLVWVPNALHVPIALEAVE